MILIEGNREALYQWDLNQRVVLKNVKAGVEVHFFDSNKTEESCLVVISYEDNGVVCANIPNKFLQKNGTIKVYIYIKEDDKSYTTHYTEILVLERPKPSDYVYTETEVKTWEGLQKYVDDNFVSKVEGEGLSKIKDIKILQWMNFAMGKPATSPIVIPDEGPSIDIKLQDGTTLGEKGIWLYDSNQIKTMMDQANTAFRTKISYTAITDDKFNDTLNAGWYKITSASNVSNYINTWMLVTKITNVTSTQDNVVPIVRQTIFGDDAIKHRTYFGKIKVTDPNNDDIIVMPWNEDGEDNSVSTFAAPPTETVTVEYLDTYWSEWIAMVNKSYVDEAIRTSILDSWEVPI